MEPKAFITQRVHLTRQVLVLFFARVVVRATHMRMLMYACLDGDRQGVSSCCAYAHVHVLCVVRICVCFSRKLVGRNASVKRYTKIIHVTCQMFFFRFAWDVIRTMHLCMRISSSAAKEIGCMRSVGR